MVYRGLKRENFLGWGTGERESSFVGLLEEGGVGNKGMTKLGRLLLLLGEGVGTTE